MAAKKYCELRNAGFAHIPSWNDAVLAQEENSYYRQELTANKKRSDYFSRLAMEKMRDECPQYFSTPASAIIRETPRKSTGCSSFIISRGRKVCL